MAKMNNRNFIGMDINEVYVALSNERLDTVVPYTNINQNTKTKYIVSREKTLASRKKKTKE